MCHDFDIPRSSCATYLLHMLLIMYIYIYIYIFHSVVNTDMYCLHFKSKGQKYTVQATVSCFYCTEKEMVFTEGLFFPTGAEE